MKFEYKEEEWRPCTAVLKSWDKTSKYEVSNWGRVRNEETKHVLSADIYIRFGNVVGRYTEVSLMLEHSKSKRFYVKDLVSEAFGVEGDGEFVNTYTRGGGYCYIDNLYRHPVEIEDKEAPGLSHSVIREIKILQTIELCSQGVVPKRIAQCVDEGITWVMGVLKGEGKKKIPKLERDPYEVWLASADKPSLKDAWLAGLKSCKTQMLGLSYTRDRKVDSKEYFAVIDKHLKTEELIGQKDAARL